MNTTQAEIDAAVAALRRGEVIGLPTETVYGLAGDASNAGAVRRIFALKGRPADHPLIVHVAEGAALDDWAREIPAAARMLAARFWPGPLTLILQRAPHVLALVTGGQDTVGLRMPSHPLAQSVLRAFGGGLAAPSANRFGRVSPTRAAHVRQEFGDAVPLVLDGRECEVGIESTIVDLSSGVPRLLRPGAIAHAALEETIGPVLVGIGEGGPRVSGSLAAHYAPRTPLELVRGDALQARADALTAQGVSVGLLTRGAVPAGWTGRAAGIDPAAYAHELYAALRALDARGLDRILVELPPQDAGWIAVNDRLGRAVVGSTRDEDDAP